jgi:hypothetical protein
MVNGPRNQISHQVDATYLPVMGAAGLSRLLLRQRSESIYVLVPSYLITQPVPPFAIRVRVDLPWLLHESSALPAAVCPFHRYSGPSS